VGRRQLKGRGQGEERRRDREKRGKARKKERERERERERGERKKEGRVCRRERCSEDPSLCSPHLRDYRGREEEERRRRRRIESLDPTRCVFRS